MSGGYSQEKKGGFNCQILANVPQYGALLDKRWWLMWGIDFCMFHLKHIFHMMYGNFSSKVWGGSKNGRVELIFYGFNFESVCVALCEESISLCFIQRAYMISTKVKWGRGGGE